MTTTSINHHITSDAPTFAVSTRSRARSMAVRAEWTKYRTLRSTWLTLAISIAGAVALGFVATASDVRQWDDMSASQHASFDATSTSLVGVMFGALVLGAIGVRTITAEYSTGMIRTSAAAIPRRANIILAKLGIVAISVMSTALVANVAGFSVGQRILASKSLQVSISDPDSVRAIVAGAIAVTAFAVIGVGLGTIVRRAAVANMLLALVVIGGQLFGSAIPTGAQKYLPFSALQASVTVHQADDLLSPMAAAFALIAYAVATVIAALALIERRDV